MDLVLLVDHETLGSLIHFSESPNGVPVRFGTLNLILVKSREEYLAWWRATDWMIRKSKTDGPISSEEATLIIDQFYEQMGLEEIRESPSTEGIVHDDPDFELTSPPSPVTHDPNDIFDLGPVREQPEDEPDNPFNPEPDDQGPVKISDIASVREEQMRLGDFSPATCLALEFKYKEENDDEPWF